MFNVQVGLFTLNDGTEWHVRRADVPVEHQDSLFIHLKQLPSVLLFGAANEAYQIAKADLDRL